MDLNCPCCTNFIYDLYVCENNHSICGDCWMKVKICPICRNQNLKSKEILTEIKKVKCKNDKCEKLIYDIDNEHEKICQYKTFICKFCRLTINNVESHFSENCVIKCEISKINYIPKEETKGKKFKLSNFKESSILFVIGTQYYILYVPNYKFYVFSTNDYYKNNKYKVQINEIERCIIFKDFELNKIIINDNNVIITQQFLLDSKIKEHWNGNSVVIETNSIEGEPGSAGNWSKEEYDKGLAELYKIFGCNKK